MSNAIYTRTCQMCGAEMHNVNSRKLYCTDCLEKRKKENNRRWNEEHQQEKKARQRQDRMARSRNTQNSDRNIAAVVRAAAAAGWSYGRQVAYMEGRVYAPRR